MIDIWFWLYIFSAVTELIFVNIEHRKVVEISNKFNCDWYDAYVEIFRTKGELDLFYDVEDIFNSKTYFKFYVLWFPYIFALIPVFNTFFVISLLYQFLKHIFGFNDE